jgi:hypothetical protein
MSVNSSLREVCGGRAMNIEVVPPDPRPENARYICNLCGQPSDLTICDECSERLRLEALSRKKREEQGNAWTRWE